MPKPDYTETIYRPTAYMDNVSLAYDRANRMIRLGAGARQGALFFTHEQALELAHTLKVMVADAEFAATVKGAANA